MVIILYSWQSEKFIALLLLRIFNAVYINRKHHARIFVTWNQGTPTKGATKHAKKKDDRIQRLYMCLTKTFAGYFWLTLKTEPFSNNVSLSNDLSSNSHKPTLWMVIVSFYCYFCVPYI